MYRKSKKIHFVGIGGIGMSGIAELLLNLGYKVSGSDLNTTATTEHLRVLGGLIHQGHDEENIGEADVVVTSSAIAEDNPEVLAARARRIPVVQRAEMLAELMRLKKFGIAIAGSHGKTTTTSMVAWLLSQAGFDPTIVIGGRVDSLGGNAHLGEGEFLVAEADESDGSFLKLSPVLEIVTNIDLEHLDYYRDIEHIKETFQQFISKIPFYGAAILCLDDENIADILPQISCRVITYGLTAQADYRGENLRFKDGRVFADVYCGERLLGVVDVAPPGRHNIYNALAAVAIGEELDISFAVIGQALRAFPGVQRRMQKKGEIAGVTVVDDYGHHPTEIRATLDAIKTAWPNKRLLALFQPHRYSRTQALAQEFRTCFHQADVLVMTEIYAASEAPIAGVSGADLLAECERHGQKQAHFIANVEDMAAAVLPMLKENDLVLTLGAGNIVKVGENLLGLLAAGREPGK
jgi:UDP-N-acetylmuramate--alanine ligase